jgi:hypothetical protein
MDNELVDFALSLILDNLRIGEWATKEVGRRFNLTDPEDDEFWAAYTTVINELIDAARKKNESSVSG